MGETLSMIHFVAKFLSPCKPVKLKRQVIISQNTIVVQALDKNYRYSDLKGEKMKDRQGSHLSQAVLKSKWANYFSFQVLGVILPGR